MPGCGIWVEAGLLYYMQHVQYKVLFSEEKRVTRSDLYRYFYGGEVASKLAAARELYDRYGEALLQQPDIRAQLSAVVEDEHALSAQMRGMQMGVTCSQCAARPGGGCCSRYMAGENDVLQLLMNLLIGVQVEAQEDDLGQCCFLGTSGCLLILKPMFCLNYNCVHIKGKEDMATLLVLEQKTGALLTRQNVLEQMLFDFFRANM